MRMRDITVDAGELGASDAKAAMSDAFSLAWEGQRRAEAAKDGLASRAWKPKAEAVASETVPQTPERQAKSALLKPENTRATNRPSWQAMDVFGRMFRAGELDAAQFDAAQKFEKHFVGATGADVRQGTGAAVDAIEDPRTYHSKMISRALACLTDREEATMEALVADPGADLKSLGKKASPSRNEDVWRPCGVLVVQGATDRLAKHWGLKQR